MVRNFHSNFSRIEKRNLYTGTGFSFESFTHGTEELVNRNIHVRFSAANSSKMERRNVYTGLQFSLEFFMYGAEVCSHLNILVIFRAEKLRNLYAGTYTYVAFRAEDQRNSDTGA